MDLIGPELFGTEWLELLKKMLHLTLFTQSLIICKYRPVSTKLGQNIYVQQNMNEFDHGSDWTGTTGVICS